MDTTTDKNRRMGAGLPDELSIVYTEETELHWRRIISAILVVLAVLTLTGWVLMNAIPAEKAAQVVSAEHDPVVAPTQSSAEASPALSGTKVIEPDQIIPQFPEEKLKEQADTQVDIPQSALPTVMQDMLPLVVHAPETHSDIAAPPLLPESQQREIGAEDATQTTLDPTYVASLQLTSALVDKSPTDLLGGEINLDGKKLIKIYAYSELTNLKGERVFHEWYKGSERVARIPVGVYLNDMRASTSKYIDPTMAGDWHLKITRTNGEQVGRMDFRVNVDS